MGVNNEFPSKISYVSYLILLYDHTFKRIISIFDPSAYNDIVHERY